MAAAAAAVGGFRGGGGGGGGGAGVVGAAGIARPASVLPPTLPDLALLPPPALPRGLPTAIAAAATAVAGYGIRVLPSWIASSGAAVVAAAVAAAPSNPRAGVEALVAAIVQSSLAACCAPALPPGITTAGRGVLRGAVMLQLVSWVDVGAARDERESGKVRAAHTYKLAATDGYTPVVCLELAPTDALRGLPSLAHGAKVVIRDAEVRRGVLLLRDGGIIILGGAAPSVGEAGSGGAGGGGGGSGASGGGSGSAGGGGGGGSGGAGGGGDGRGGGHAVGMQGQVATLGGVRGGSSSASSGGAFGGSVTSIGSSAGGSNRGARGSALPTPEAARAAFEAIHVPPSPDATRRSPPPVWEVECDSSGGEDDGGVPTPAARGSGGVAHPVHGTGSTAHDGVDDDIQVVGTAAAPDATQADTTLEDFDD